MGDVIPCGGLRNQEFGCQEIFSRQQYAGLCLKCQKLQDRSLTDTERAIFQVSPAYSAHCERPLSFEQAMPQCKQCGVFGTNVNDPCGACRAKSMWLFCCQYLGSPKPPPADPVTRESGLPNPNLMLGPLDRRLLVEKQMHLPPSPAQLLSPVHLPGGAKMSVAEMTIIHAHKPKQPTRAKTSTFLVAWEVRRSDATKSTDADLGTSCKPFDEDTRLVGMYSLKTFAYFKMLTSGIRIVPCHHRARQRELAHDVFRGDYPVRHPNR